MSAVINSLESAPDEQPLPWYRYGWPWFLISIPFVSVTLGCTMLYLAFQTNNSLVVDDYYKQGKAINLRIERDRQASLLGLAGELSSTSEGLVLQMGQLTPEGLPAGLKEHAEELAADLVWPEKILLRWVHVTQAERDGGVEMTSIGGQRFIAPSAKLPETGKYRVHVQPPDHSNPDSDLNVSGKVDIVAWRLISELVSFSATSTVAIKSPAPETVLDDALMH